MTRTKRLVGIVVALGIASAVGVGVSAALTGDPVQRTAAPERLATAEANAFRAMWEGFRSEPNAAAPIVRHVETTQGGDRWSVMTWTNVRGEKCSGIVVPGEGTGGDCNERADGDPVLVHHGSRQKDDPLSWDTQAVWGVVDSARVARIELLDVNCKATAIEWDQDGVFLELAGPSAMRDGAWPYAIVAYDARGEVVQASKVLLLPPDTGEAIAAGVRAPSPKASCAVAG